MSAQSRMSSTGSPAEGVLETRGERPVLRFERRLARPVERVWQAITEPEEIAGWFPARVDIELKPSGSVRFSFDTGEVMSGEVREIDPPVLLEYTWDKDVLRFELSPDGDGCRLVFTNVLDDPDAAAKVAAGWHECLDLLKAALAGEPAGESLGRWDELYPVYLGAFGREDGPIVAEAPDGTVETTPDGSHVLRFERRFNRPVERIWAALTRPDELAKWLAEADIDLVEGGRVELRWQNTDSEGNQSVARGTITTLEPQRVLEMGTDVHGRLRWELEAEGESCRLTFTCTLSHADATTLAENLGGWHIHFDHLADSLAGKPVDWAHWNQDHRPIWQVYHDRYAARLAEGSTPGTVAAGNGEETRRDDRHRRRDRSG